MRKNTKRALLLSCLSLLLCVSMLVGTTFAWFTDTDTTAVANVVTGTLDIEILGEDGALKNDALKFKSADTTVTNILWEPGATYRTEGFKLTNLGNLSLKYKLQLNNTEISYNKLNEVITWSVLDASGNAIDIDNFESSIAPNKGETGLMYIQGTMSKDAGNEYQGLTLSAVGITVLAAQHSYEVDMTDNTYDEDAEYKEGPGIFSVPKNDDIPQTDIQTALNTGAGGVINFAGSTVVQKPGSGYAMYYPKLPADNSTIKNLNTDGSLYGLEMHGDITFEDCNFAGQYAMNISDGNNAVPGKAVFKNCTFQGWLSFDANTVTSVEFIDCEFLSGKHTLFLNSYQDTTFTNCTFDSAFGIDDESSTEQTWTFNGCTLAAAKLNATGSYKTVKIVEN